MRTVFLHENGRFDGETVLSDQTESSEAICPDQDCVDGELEPQGHFREEERDAIDGSHQQEDAPESAPAVWDRVVACTEDGTDDEHHDIACKMAECGCPVGISRHEDHYNYGRDGKSGKSDPDGHVGLPGELIPHRNIEKHSENHVGEQHHRYDSYSRAELRTEDQGYDVYI